MSILNFDSLPKNPIVVARDERGLTQTELARLAEVNIQTIRDVEKGILPNLPNSLVKIFDSQISSRYHEWQLFKRRCIYLPPPRSVTISSGIHPFAQYLNILDWKPAKFAEYLCLSRYIVLKYIKNQRKMPDVLKVKALPQAHMSPEDVQWLARLGVLHYDLQKEARINAESRRQNLIS